MSDITLYRSSDEDITFQYYEANGTTPRTLVGATVFFTVKDNYYDNNATDTTAIITKTVTSHTTPASGITTINLSDTQTTVDPKVYFYDVRVKEVDGSIHMATQGNCTVIGTPTNRQA